MSTVATIASIDKAILRWSRNQSHLQRIVLVTTILSSVGVGCTATAEVSRDLASSTPNIFFVVILVCTIILTATMDAATAYLHMRDYDDKVSRAGEVRRALQRVADHTRLNLVCRKVYRQPFLIFFQETHYAYREAITRLGSLGIVPDTYEVLSKVEEDLPHKGTRSTSVTPGDDARTAEDSD